MAAVYDCVFILLLLLHSHVLALTVDHFSVFIQEFSHNTNGVSVLAYIRDNEYENAYVVTHGGGC